MAMRMPVRGGLMHGLADFSPRLKAPTLKCQRAQHLPPGLDQGEVGRILRLADELPTGRGARTQQDIGGPMGTQISHDRIDPLDVRGKPRLHLRQAIYIGCRRPAGVRRRQGFTSGGLEGADEIPLAPPPLVNRLGSPLGRCRWPARGHSGGRNARRPPRHWPWQSSTDLFLHRPQLPSRKALRTLRPHLIQAHDNTARRRRGRERRDDSLLSATAGLTRSPNQVACVR
jgi:hypothetical protein